MLETAAAVSEKTAVTAETITDAQISSLLSASIADGNHGVARYCDIALDNITQSPKARHISKHEAKEVLAAEWNARRLPKRFKWTVEIEVDATWVADGFDLTDSRALSMLEKHLAYAYSHELGAKVVGRPDMGDVNEVQGDRRDHQREGWPVVAKAVR